MQLLAKQQNIAIEDAAGVLIDWIDISGSQSLNLVVINDGEAEDNAIASLLLETSNDGGVTLASEATELLTAPIALTASKTIAITPTTTHMRLKAACAEDESTQASAYLMADSIEGAICTLADIKTRLAITSTDYDIMIRAIVNGIERLFCNYCGREFIVPVSDITEYYSGQGARLQLRRYPLVSITSIKQSSFYDFDNADSLVADTDYRILNNGKEGILYRVNRQWLGLDDSIQIVYRAGYQAAGAQPATGFEPMPADLREAAIQQCCLVFKRRDDIGLSGVSFDGGSMNKFTSLDLLPLVKQTLEQYKRITL